MLESGWGKNSFFSGSNIILISSQGVVQKIFKGFNFGLEVFWNTDSTILYQKVGNRNFYIFNIITREQKTLLKNENLGWVFFPCTYKNEGIITFWNRWDNDKDQQDLENVGLWLISSKDSTQYHLFRGRVFPLKLSEDGKFIYAITEDGKWIYAINIDKASSTDSLNQMASNLGEFFKLSSNNKSVKEKIKIPFDDVWEADITPDGKIIVCTVGEQNSDVWMIENFDPDVE